MTPSLRRTTQLLALVLAALLLGGSVGLAAASAQAAQVTVTLTPQGPTPEFIEVPVGGTVVFVNEDTTTHRVFARVEEGKSTAWEYESGPLEPGATSPATDPFGAAGRYVFDDVQGVLLPRTFRDEIGVLPAASPSPTPDPSTSPEPNGSPTASPGASPSASGAPGGPSESPGASPGAPAPTGGTGTTRPLPLDGGFAGLGLGSTGSSPVQIPGDPLAPAIAPPPLADDGPLPLPYIAAAPGDEAPSVAALPTGSLPGVDTGRDLGLPAVLGALAIVGLVSMIVRVLLAEPAARRPAEAHRGLRPVVVTG